MSEQAEKTVNIEEIMEEIRAEIRKRGPREQVPAFSSIPISQAPAARDWTVTCAYQPAPGNKLKRIYNKVVSKLVRCALFPLTERLTGIHQEMKQCLDELNYIVEDQQREIDALYQRIEKLEEGK